MQLVGWCGAILATALSLAACSGKDDDPAEPNPPDTPSEAWRGCGDGEVTAPEECDDGAGNSDSSPNACRTDCRAAHCGDGVVDAADACDDGDAWGGDGCLPSCEVEEGPFEKEPNDLIGQRLPEGGEVAGSLTAFDRDCFTFPVGQNGWLHAEIIPLLPGVGGRCDEIAVIELVDDDLDTLSVGWPDPNNGCAILTPADSEARYLEEGTYGICVQGLFNAEVHSYRLLVEIGDDSCDIPGLEPGTDDDLDGDGLADECDDDDDGDGIDDLGDNCPRTSNGPRTQNLHVNDEGYLMSWLVLAPMPSAPSPDQCLPGPVDLLGDDAAATPRLGDLANGFAWSVLIDTGDRMDFQDYYGYQPAPRELYAVAYVYAPIARRVDLAMGFDDGMRLWFNHALVDEMPTCQGANADQYVYPVDLVVGWNQITVRLYDGGGGWAMYARFKDGSNPVTDIQLSISPDGPTRFDQSDFDGDGIGDACDLDNRG